MGETPPLERREEENNVIKVKGGNFQEGVHMVRRYVGVEKGMGTFSYGKSFYD